MNGAGNDFMVIDARGLTLDFERKALEYCKLAGAVGFIDRNGGGISKKIVVLSK